MNKNHIGQRIYVDFICPNAYWEQFYRDSNESHTDWKSLTSKINRMMKGEQS